MGEVLNNPLNPVIVLFVKNRENNHSKTYSKFTPKNIAVLLLVPFVANLDLFYHQIAWSDDFAIKAESINTGGRETLLEISANLRPLYALFLKVVFSRITHENDVIYLQVFSLIGMCLLSLLLFKILFERGFSSKFSLVTITMLNCLPSFQQYTHFSTIAIFSWVCAGSTLAFYLISKSNFRYLLLSVALIFIGTLIYPPAALFGLALLSIDVTYEINQGKSIFSHTFMRKVKMTFLMYGIGSISGLIFAYAYGFILGVQFADRTKLITSLSLFIEKCQWIFTHLLISEFRPFAIGAGDMRIVALQVLPAIILLARALILNHSVKLKLSILSLIFFPIISCLPNLVIAENQFEFRTLPGLCFGGMFVYCYLAVTQLKKILSRLSISVTNVVILMLLSTIVVNSQWNSYELWTSPGKIRKEIVNSQASKLTKNVCVYLPDKSLEPLARLGIYSMRTDLQSEWVTDNLFVFIPTISRDTQVFVVKDKSNCVEGDSILDFSPLGDISYRRFIW